MALSILEELCYSTTRIETKDKEGNLYSGTGFFYSFNIKDNKVVPLLCTNKHVIEGMTEITLTLTKADKEGNPLDLEHITVTLRNNQSDWISSSHLDSGDMLLFQKQPAVPVRSHNPLFYHF